MSKVVTYMVLTAATLAMTAAVANEIGDQIVTLFQPVINSFPQ